MPPKSRGGFARVTILAGSGGLACHCSNSTAKNAAIFSRNCFPRPSWTGVSSNVPPAGQKRWNGHFRPSPREMRGLPPEDSDPAEAVARAASPEAEPGGRELLLSPTESISARSFRPFCGFSRQCPTEFEPVPRGIPQKTPEVHDQSTQQQPREDIHHIVVPVVDS